MPNIFPMLIGAYQKPAKKSPVPKKGGEPAAKGGPHTQVGELDDELKEPTPAMKVKRIAHEEKLHATRQWVAGHLSDAKHAQVHRRANHAIKHAKKLGSKY
jgi:hypothetical protein